MLINIMFKIARKIQIATFPYCIQGLAQLLSLPLQALFYRKLLVQQST